jgi:hypothetical protein
MKTEYDLTRMKRRKNPFASLLKKQATIHLKVDVTADSQPGATGKKKLSSRYGGYGIFCSNE